MNFCVGGQFREHQQQVVDVAALPPAQSVLEGLAARCQRRRAGHVDVEPVVHQRRRPGSGARLGVRSRTPCSYPALPSRIGKRAELGGRGVSCHLVATSSLEACSSRHSGPGRRPHGAAIGDTMTEDSSSSLSTCSTQATASDAMSFNRRSHRRAVWRIQPGAGRRHRSDATAPRISGLVQQVTDRRRSPPTATAASRPQPHSPWWRAGVLHRLTPPAGRDEVSTVDWFARPRW